MADIFWLFKLMKGTLNFPNVKCQHFFTSSSENPGTNSHECGVIILINCARLFKLFLFIYNVNRIYIPFPVLKGICFVTLVVFKSIALGKFQRKNFELRLWEGICIKIAVKKVESVGIWDGLYYVYFNMGLPQTIPWMVLSILPISCSSMSRIMVMADRVRASL